MKKNEDDSPGKQKRYKGRHNNKAQKKYERESNNEIKKRISHKTTIR